MNLWAKWKEWNGRCRTCETDSISGGLGNQFPELQPLKPLKFGELHQCSKCQRFWFLPEHAKWLHRIHDHSWLLVCYWNEHTLTVEPQIANVLAGIGGVMSYYQDYIAVPCTVENKSGERHEKAVVLISREPPYRWPEPRSVHWANEIGSVESSPFALSLAVRRASSEKHEEAMGYAPTGVQDSHGGQWILGCESRFFDHDGIKGQELQLSERPGNRRNVVWPEREHPIYFVDWFDGCEELFCRVTENDHD